MNGKDQESNWDSLASQLGLEPAPRPTAPTRTSPEPSEPPAGESEPRFEKVGEIIPARVTEIEMKVTAVNDVVESPPTEDVGEDAADVLDDEAPETAEETTAEEAAEGDGKGRRRRRRRRRRKGGEAIAAESTAAIEPEEAGEAEVLAFPTLEDEVLAEDVSAEAAGEAETAPGEEEEVEEIVPDVALAEEIEDESAEPLPEWKVTAWTDLVATLYRPQDR